ncbi:hypothetical protein DPMN_163327 [Dreissena polymorpha]|uniref:Uncharacterized protein n=1 Tax=Dreissena polymorpha TaxID=45954 RepID=A0A9D4IUH4_DREPO|nr:hypothetical protein DPMN_163327 [Dreissena polymorpha]
MCSPFAEQRWCNARLLRGIRRGKMSIKDGHMHFFSGVGLRSLLCGLWSICTTSLCRLLQRLGLPPR